MDLDNLIELFTNDKEIGIIGHNRYLQPFYYGLNDNYKTNLNKLLELFNLQEDININYFKILNNNNLITKNNNFNFEESKKYLEYRSDLHYANIKYNECFPHFNNNKNTELNHAGYNINDTKFIKFIAGTIFIEKSAVLKKIKDNYSDNIIILKEKIEKINYYSNFDHNGTLFRYTNALEYVLQAIIYKFNYKVYGFDPTDVLDNSLYLKNLDIVNINLPKINKKRILFVSNELSKTGAPIVLINIINKVMLNYDVYLLSYYGGDNVEYFKELLGDNNVFVIYKNNRELGINNYNNLIDLCKKISDKINPDLVYINTLVNTYAIYGFYNKHCKIILHVHEAEDEIIRLYNAGLIIGYDFYNYVDQIISVNDNIIKIIKNCCKIRIPMNVIYNDIHNYEKYIDENEITSFFKTKNIDTTNKIIIGGVGSICYRKGFDIFIKLAELYKEFSFIWATNNNYNDKLPENMQIINCNTQKEMTLFYKNITVFLLTSRSEAFPLAFWECLLNKKYVILSNKTIPLDINIFNMCNISVLNGLSSVKLFIPFLEDIRNNKIDIDALNKNINIEFIKNLCSQNVEKIERIITELISNKVTNLELKYPNEFDLYKKLNIYNKFHSYNLQDDLLIHKFNNFDNSIFHYLNNGFCEGRQIYKFPCLIKKRILFVFHELTFNGATRVGLDIANNLQNMFDVIVISWGDGDMIKDYAFENKPIIIRNREFEHDLIKYLDRVELAKKILNELNPDLVYITSSVSHDFYHAALSLNLPSIYHNHEGKMGYESELKGRQIPIDKFCQYYKPKNTLFYSASPLTTECIKNILGVTDDELIKEFQTINFTSIDNLKNHEVINIKINNKKIIGMVGTQIYRKGYDIFLKLAEYFKEYDFCWVGCEIQNEIEYKNNLIFVKHTNNPYKYIKQFDYFLCTSREDIFGLVLLESLYLNIPTFLLKSAISSWKLFNEFGAYYLNGEANFENFSIIIKNISNYNNKIINVSQILKNKYDIREHIQNITNDIIYLTDGLIGENKKSYYYDEKYGYMIYNYTNINDIINLFHKTEIFNYEIYKNKYKDLELVLKNENEYKKHWELVGYKTRNLEKDDWKLFILQNIHLLYNCIDSKEKLDMNNYNYKNISIEFDSFKYLNKFEDLKKVFNDNELSARDHFIGCGCFEGRTIF
jgi:hypothetical protein